ncbi:hypothetical protein [Kitasatospora sp. NBC_00315]|uniref:hypothetical protein n=1 Tax=Kitasatospora sp. NBC_00315 TaxID=2975963 RepID=UPI003252E39D
MDIQVEYEATGEDITASVVANSTARPALRWAGFGLCCLLAVLGIVAGSVLLTLPALLLAGFQLWNLTVGPRQIGAKVGRWYVGPTAVRITDLGLSVRTDAGLRELSWAMVTRIADNPVAWTIMAKRAGGGAPVAATILKAAFSPEERAGFSAFLAGLPGVRYRRTGAPASAVPAPLGTA